MDSAESTNDNARNTQKSSTIKPTPKAIRKLARSVLEGDSCNDLKLNLQETDEETAADEADDSRIVVSLLASGGYNDVWLATETPDEQSWRVAQVITSILRTIADLLCRLAGADPKSVHENAARNSQPEAIIIRLPNEDSLRPYQVHNEVGWLRYLKTQYPEIPVPEVYSYSDGEVDKHHPFIVEEYINGKPLSETWVGYTNHDKETIATQIARLVVRLGEIRFDKIGGRTSDGRSGPTVEGCKLFKGRDAFHSTECYPIGPYETIDDYIIAMYDKEIYFYTHAEDSTFDDDYFEDTARSDFIESLKAKRATIRQDMAMRSRKEPLVLCHNDLHGRNILVKDLRIVGIIDWEFAGSFPLSELIDHGVEALEVEDETSEEECSKWCDRIQELIGKEAKRRGWADEDVELLIGAGDTVLQAARVEMFPSRCAIQCPL